MFPLLTINYSILTLILINLTFSYWRPINIIFISEYHINCSIFSSILLNSTFSFPKAKLIWYSLPNSIKHQYPLMDNFKSDFLFFKSQINQVFPIKYHKNTGILSWILSSLAFLNFRESMQSCIPF